MLATLPPEFAALYKALDTADYEEAFALAILQLEQPKTDQQALALASIFALYGEEGVEGGLHCLNGCDKESDLFFALKAEFLAIEDSSKPPVKDMLAKAKKTKDALSLFHFARAQYLLKAFRPAQRLMKKLNQEDLPPHLAWRYWSLKGEISAQLGKAQDAAAAFEKALDLAHDRDKPSERLSLAECWLRMGYPERCLNEIDKGEAYAKQGHIVRDAYLRGVAQRQLSNYKLAFEHLQKAYTLAEANLPFELFLELARLFADTEQFQKAFENYECALNSSPDGYENYVLHEYARVLREAEQFEEAARALKRVVRQARYTNRAQAFADLAEVTYLLGNFDQVKPLAQFALKGGVVAPACLSLGRVALEYFRLDEAESWFEQAISASTEGEMDWLSAELLLIETFAQRIADAPEKLISHAERALKYLHPQDDWVATLNEHVSSAKEQLEAKPRLLN